MRLARHLTQPPAHTGRANRPALPSGSAPFPCIRLWQYYVLRRDVRPVRTVQFHVVAGSVLRTLPHCKPLSRPPIPPPECLIHVLHREWPVGCTFHLDLLHGCIPRSLDLGHLRPPWLQRGRPPRSFQPVLQRCHPRFVRCAEQLGRYILRLSRRRISASDLNAHTPVSSARPTTWKPVTQCSIAKDV